MDSLMKTEDSYADRRQLFKSIWQTAMTIHNKDPPEIMNKPKVIKTLRLDELDHYGINRQKKLKLKNLRAVCNKILDFCDRQEADDMLYQKMNPAGQGPHNRSPTRKHKKIKTRAKQKTRNVKNIYSPARNTIRTVAEGKKDDLKIEKINTSPIVKTALITHSIKSPFMKSRLNSLSKEETSRRNEVKKNVKTNKESMMSRSSGTPNDIIDPKYNYFTKPDVVGRVSLYPPKKLLQVHKINIG